jgi:hypothetical protein
MAKASSYFKTCVEGEFAGVVEAACHDNAVSYVFANWWVGSFQRVAVSRYQTVLIDGRSG